MAEPSKKCFKCLTIKPLTEFYKHPKMADGRVGKCKECNKKDVSDNRYRRIDYYRDYDRKRGSRMTKEDLQEYRLLNPKKYRAHCLVSYAKRVGHIKEQPCEVCGLTKNIHAHHDDYNKPLDVRWLCAVHHQEWHKFHTPIGD